ncbi:uncharacterized protein RCO7_09419 [Rhynchosporium graminicola]|uniref:Uncharacterized protein n=1 Tax=Rhynchosporium graminicola TaxID=2792576 RepID=A0A1E1KWK2_9HELO|nr:uncharacterized protein RCO7_09419 [Rhynchosporium commune]
MRRSHSTFSDQATPNRNPSVPQDDLLDEAWDHSLHGTYASSRVSDESAGPSTLPHLETNDGAGDGANYVADSLVKDSGFGSEISTPGLGDGNGLSDCANDLDVPQFEVVEPLPGFQRMFTVVILHPGGSSGAKFKHKLLESSKCSSGKTLREELPSLRWIFPDAPLREYLYPDGTVERRHTWVDSYNQEPDDEATVKRLKQMKSSMAIIRQGLDREVERLLLDQEIESVQGWEAEQIVLGGHDHGGMPAMFRWMCMSIKVAGFVAVKNILTSSELTSEGKQRSKDEVQEDEIDLESFQRHLTSLLVCKINGGRFVGGVTNGFEPV